MKSVIIYNSQTGFTKQYAQWLSEELACEVVSFNEAKSRKYDEYDNIIFGSWCHAGNIVKIDWFKQLMEEKPKKKYAIFAVGASPLENPEVDMLIDKIIPEDSFNCKVFYCPGGIRYDKMKFLDRKLMKMFTKALSKKKDATVAERMQAEMISHDYDIQEKKYIEPIIDWIK